MQYANFLKSPPGTPVATNSDPTKFWIDIHGTTSERFREIIRKIQNEVRFRVIRECEPFQASATCGCSFHLNIIIQN